MELNQSSEDALRSITSEMFEDLCLALLQSMGFRNTYRVGHHNDRDRGRDIEAVYPRMLPDGQNQINERWFFECKHQEKNLSVDDIQSKVAWAEASRADFLVLLSFADLTSNARQYIADFQNNHRLRILTWTGKDLLRRFRQHPRVLKEVLPQTQHDPVAKAQFEAEERIILARNILTTIGILTPDLDPSISRLVEEVVSRCVRREDVKSLKMESLGDGASEIVYLLGASGNKVLNESQLFSALASILDKYPNDNVAWQIAKYFRTTNEHSNKRAIRYFLMGPVASGKSCLLATLLFEILRDRRFAFEAKTLLGLSSMHRALRDGSMPPRTDVFGQHRFGIHVESRKLFRKATTPIELLDISGEIFHHINGGKGHFTQEIEGLLNQRDRILLVFDPTGRRLILHEDDEGQVLPCIFDENVCEQYRGFLEWAKGLGVSVIPVVTKIDLISNEDLNEKVLPTLRSLLPNSQHPFFTTSVLKKQQGDLVPQAIGIAELIDLVATYT